MPFLKLSDEQIAKFGEIAEFAMDVHLVSVMDTIGAVIGCSVLLVSDQKAVEQSAELLGGPVLQDKERFEEWRISLEKAPIMKPMSQPLVARMIVNLGGYLPPVPPRPAVVYGHLPFSGATQANDVVYRCECWPTSRKINVTTGVVAPDTFTFPPSELQFVPTGFAAVGRYALPSLPPACNRYELHPPANTPMRCGASVPLYGQAGGGVEVLFHRGFQNNGPIAAPHILPPL